MRADDDHLTRALAAADLANGVPLGNGISRDRVRDAHGEPRRRARLEQAAEQGIVLVGDGDLGQRQDAVGRAAHVEEPVLLARVQEDAERPGAVQQKGQIVGELLHARPRRRVEVAERREHGAEEVALPLRVGGGHGRPVRVPHERRHSSHHPCLLHPTAIHREAVGRGGVDPYHGPREGGAARARRPGPARRNHVVRARLRHARPHRSTRPGAAELPRLEVRVQAVALEPLERPIVRPAGGGRSGEPRADDVAQVLEILHHLRTAERLVDQGAGPRRVDDEVLPGCGADRK